MLLLLSATAAAVLSDARATDAMSDQAIIVTGTRLPEGTVEVEERPGGANIVKATEYRDKLAVSLKDALEFSPGVYAQPRFGQEVRLSIRGSGISRGFHLRGLTILQDGISLNLADDDGDFQELDPAILDHIEIYRGANAFRFGGTTLGGAINGVTPTGRTAPGFAARLDGGSYVTARGLLTYGWSGSTSDAWFAISGDRSDGGREHAKRSSLRANGNAGVKLAPNVETRFYVSANTIDQELPGALPYETAIHDPKAGSFAGDQQRDIDSLRVQNRTTVDLDDVALEFGAFANARKLYHPIFQVIDQKSLDKGLFGRVGWQSGPLELHAGATARFGHIDARRFVNVNGERGAPTLVADQDARTIDVYGEGRLRTGDVTWVAGAVYTNGMREQDQRFPVPLFAKATFNQLSPRIGVIWKPSPNVDIYANYSRSHELPGFTELAQVAAFVPLKAQHAWTAEIGSRGHLGPARWDVSFYRAQVRNELLQFAIGPDIPATTFNAGRTLHQGIEAGLDLELTPWASLRQAYQFNDFRFENDAQFDDNRLPVIPKHLYRAGLRIGPGKWHLEPVVEWVPGGAWADYANSFRTRGYAMLNLSGDLKIGDKAALFLDARNLTNRRAVGDISAVVDYRALQPSQQAIFYPVDRRSVFAGIRMRW